MCNKYVSKYILPSQINLIFITYTKYKYIEIENCGNCGKVRWQEQHKKALKHYFHCGPLKSRGGVY